MDEWVFCGWLYIEWDWDYYCVGENSDGSGFLFFGRYNYYESYYYFYGMDE
jgi:hypothetical protein